MTLRKDLTPRTFTAEMPLRHELERAVQSTQQSLDLIPRISFRWVREIVATGVSGAVLTTVQWDEPTPPSVALLVRVVPHADRTGDVGNVRPRLNFAANRDGVVIYEPAGLTANATYDLIVQFVGGV